MFIILEEGDISALEFLENLKLNYIEKILPFIQWHIGVIVYTHFLKSKMPAQKQEFKMNLKNKKRGKFVRANVEFQKSKVFNF